MTEGRWDAILTHMQPGDYVLMQFGHNDGGQLFKGSRASIKGNGVETKDGVVECTCPSHCSLSPWGESVIHHY